MSPSFRRFVQAAVPPVMLTAMIALVVGFAAISVSGSLAGAV